MMSLAGLLAAVAEDPQLSTALASPPDLPGGERDLVAPPALRPLIVATLAAGTGRDGPGRFVLAVTATAREAEDLTAALGAFLPPDTVASFPGWETLPHERLSPCSDTVGQRIAVLRRLTHPADGGPLKVVVAPVRSVLQPIVAGLGDLEPVRLREGDEADQDDVIARLVDIGYARMEMVTKRGAGRANRTSGDHETNSSRSRTQSFGSWRCCLCCRPWPFNLCRSGPVADLRELHTIL